MSERYFAWCELSVSEDEKNQDHDNKKRIILLKFLHQASRTSAPLGHGENSCPVQYFYKPEVRQRVTLPPTLPKEKTIRVGVCVMVRHNDRILITRRTAQMRTFALKWVFPGGHVNAGETFEQAGIREVEEETGLKVTDLKLYGMWESCYPTYIEQGAPLARHLVLYYMGEIVPGTSDKLTLQTAECDSATWLSQEQVNQVLNKEGANEEFDALTLNSESQLVPTKFKYKQLIISVDDNANAPRESLALGTDFVFKRWVSDVFAHHSLEKVSSL
jgi:mutator protein MutT